MLHDVTVYWRRYPQRVVFAGEPVFVPKVQPESEDDGWILDLIYDSEHHRSDLVIFDGKDISVPVATLHLRQHIPYGLHGSWKAGNI